MRTNRLLTWLFGGLFPLIGVVLIVIGIWSIWSHDRARQTGVLTTGQVVGIEERRYVSENPHDEPDYSMYAPIIRFTCRLCSSSFRARRGSWLKRLPCVYSGM